MYIFEWDETLLTGNASIDHQHKELYERIKAFFKATTRNRESEVVDEMLHFLNGFLVEHFADEEKLHRDGGYPDLEKHTEAHNRILKDLNEIDRLYMKDGYTERLDLKLYNLLIRDMVAQIKEYDIPLARFVQEKRENG